MNAPPSFSEQKRRWFQLGLRHLRAAATLNDVGLSDAATFNAIHAYECIISAVIAWKGYPVPADGQTPKNQPHPGPKGLVQSKNRSTHVCKRLLFEDCADHAAPYFRTHRALATFVTNLLRSESLYYQPLLDQMPHQTVAVAYAQRLTAQIRLFAREVWQEIK